MRLKARWKGLLGLEAAFQRQLDQPDVLVAQTNGGLAQATPPDVGHDRLAHRAAKQPAEVKGREAARRGDPLDADRLAQMGFDKRQGLAEPVHRLCSSGGDTSAR